MQSKDPAARVKEISMVVLYRGGKRGSRLEDIRSSGLETTVDASGGRYSSLSVRSP